MKVIKTFTALCFAAGMTTSNATDFSEVTNLVNDMKQQTNFPYGTAIAVVKGDEIIYQGYFGYSDIENKTEVNAATPFYIASITKPYFALSMLLKEQQGQIDESTTMATLFPKLNFANIDAKQVTVKHLLSHTMGIDNSPLAMISAYRGGHNLTERQQLVANSYPNSQAPLGTFDYSNVGYNILSVWVDQTEQMPWQAMLDNTVFQPLSLVHTSAYISDIDKKHWQKTKPYSISKPEKEPLYLSKYNDTMHSAGGMVSSAKDMASFLIAQLNQGKVNGKQVFPVEVINKSQQPLASLNKSYGEFKRDQYAWGWYVGPYLNETLYHHFGGYAGTHSHLSFMPEKNIGVVILNNEDMLSSKFTGIIAKQIYSLLLDDKNANITAKAEANTLRNKLNQLSQQLAKQQKKLAERKWQLSLEKHSYTGSYKHPLLGEVLITKDDNNSLNVSWGHLSTIATAYTKPDTMRVELIPNNGEIIQFSVNNQQVTGLTYNNEAFVKN